MGNAERAQWGAQIIFPKSGRGLCHVARVISIDFIGVPDYQCAGQRPDNYNRYYNQTVYVGGRKIINKVNYCYECKKKVVYDHLITI